MQCTGNVVLGLVNTLSMLGSGLGCMVAFSLAQVICLQPVPLG